MTSRRKHVHHRQAVEELAWLVQGLPYAHPDPTLPAVVFNDQLDAFKNAPCAGRWRC